MFLPEHARVEIEVKIPSLSALVVLVDNYLSMRDQALVDAMQTKVDAAVRRLRESNSKLQADIDKEK